MGSSQLEFASKVRRINRKHSRLARGMDSQMRDDGLIVARPRRRNFAIPFKGFVAGIAGIFGFKVLLLVIFGEITYQGRVADLAEGTSIERAGAWLMQLDPVTAFIAQFINYYL
ncbi:hypothetical protein [Algirhabdus cladophorae]|uniref:hypothetical protein n=1 Tax=Algirhabdus cladophorae TaxID=3377108 RepID=UPI003B84B45E